MKRIITTAAVLTIAFFNAQQVKKDSASSKEIQEVTMTKKVFQKKADRMVFDVANSPIAKGTTGFDLLKETPMRLSDIADLQALLSSKEKEALDEVPCNCIPGQCRCKEHLGL